MADGAPDWNAPAPAEAVAVVIDALDYTAAGDPDRACAALADTDAEAGWLKVVAVDVLVGLCRHDPSVYADLREQLHERALSCAAPDDQLRASLYTVALADARDRRADLRVMELDSMSEFTDYDIACVACQLAGQVATCVYGDALADRLHTARKLYGGAPRRGHAIANRSRRQWQMTDIPTTAMDLADIGEHKPDHRRGLLVFASLPPDVQRAEDATAMADLENRHYRSAVVRTRPATATEKALLAYLGHTVPDDLQTTVRWVSSGVRNRSWPTLGIGENGVAQ